MSTYQRQSYGRSRQQQQQYDSITDESASSFKKWSCTACTYENEAEHTKCEMCLTAKPKQLAQQQNNGHNSPPNSHNNGYHSSSQHSQKFSPRLSPQTSPNSSSQKPKGIKFNTIAISPPDTPSNTKHNDQKFARADDAESTIPRHITFNPKKPISKQSIFERWMIAQIETQSGQQPAICVKNNVLLTNLRRVRAPTTFHTLQQQINQNTDAIKHAEYLDAGDFTDDEEDDLSGFYPANSPRSASNSGNYSFTPTPSDNEEDMNTPSYSGAPNKYASTTKLLSRDRRHARHSQDDTDYEHRNNHHGLQHSDNTWNKSLYSSNTNTTSNTSNDNNDDDQLSPLPDTSQKNENGLYSFQQNSNQNKNGFVNKNVRHRNNMSEDHGNKKNGGGHLKRTLSTDNATIYLKKKLNSRRRKQTKKRNMSVKQLWFKAQSQLKQGRNPPILAKYNIVLQNIRQHNPRFQDYERRKSHHEKAATYLQVNGDRLTRQRQNIDGDDDDFSDTENEISTSQHEPTTPTTPRTNQYVE